MHSDRVCTADSRGSHVSPFHLINCGVLTLVQEQPPLSPPPPSLPAVAISVPPSSIARLPHKLEGGMFSLPDGAPGLARLLMVAEIPEVRAATLAVAMVSALHLSGPRDVTRAVADGWQLLGIQVQNIQPVP